MKHKYSSSISIQLFLLAVVAGLLVYFYQLNNLNSEQHSKRINVLLAAKDLDAKFDQVALQILTSTMKQYDSLLELYDRMDQLELQLSREQGLLHDTHTDIVVSGEKLSVLLTEKLALIERLKTQSAIVRNGFLYLPTLSEELYNHPFHEIEHPDSYVTALFAFRDYGSSSSREELAEKLKSIEHWVKQHPHDRMMSNFLLHIEASLKGQRKLYQLRDQFIEVPSKVTFQDLHERYQAYHRESVKQTQLLSFKLMAACLVLVIFLIVILRRLDKSRVTAEQASNRLHDAVGSLQEGFALFAADGSLVLSNQRWAELYDLSRQQHQLTLQLYQAEREQSAVSRTTHTDRDSGLSYTLEQLNNNRWVQASDVETSDGGLVCVRTDITQQREDSEKLRIASVVFETTQEGIITTDAERRIQAVNPAFCRISGYPEKELLGNKPSMLRSGQHNETFYDTMWGHINNDGAWAGEVWNRRKDGSIYPQWLSVNAVQDESGEIVQYIAVVTDISERKAQEEQIHFQAYYDALTSLPNRALLLDRLEHDLELSKRNELMGALLFIDLDRFKRINDTMGHELGDKLLIQVAERLKDVIRSSDTIARFGGDEFVILLSEIQDPQQAAVVAEKVVSTLSQPFELNGYDVFTGASIGIALSPSDSHSAVELLRLADLAMYKAKEMGRNQFHFFAQSMQDKVNRRVELEHKLRSALSENQFQVYYQPIVNLETGSVYGVEALLRWFHPEEGMISPVEFIPVAEETGMIASIGEWVLEQACHDIAMLQQQYPQLHLSVNLSTRQYHLGFDIHRLNKAIAQTGIAKGSLTLEITESILLEEDKEVMAWLNSFKQEGVQLSVDDFGTGYSSLSYLKRFPISILKIDRSFVSDINRDQEAVLLVDAIISMARSLKMQVIAEGVEDSEQLQTLNSLGCDNVQGFHFSKPIPCSELQQWLQQSADLIKG